MTPTELGCQLEQRRKKLKISKRAVASRAHLSLPTVNRILSGQEKRPSIFNVSAIANVLGVEIRIGANEGVKEIGDAFERRKLQASAQAKRLVSMVQGNMALEAQAVNSEKIQQMIDQTTCELLTGPDRNLWG